MKKDYSLKTTRIIDNPYLSIVYIDTGKKLIIEEINEQLWRDAHNPKMINNDEERFLNYLLRKWSKE